MNSVSDGTYSASYTYLANSPLVSQISLKQNTTSRMVVSRQFDYLDRLLQVSSVPQGVNQLPFEDLTVADGEGGVDLNLWRMGQAED